MFVRVSGQDLNPCFTLGNVQISRKFGFRRCQGAVVKLLFPLWLAPDQVRVITLNDDQALIDYAQPIVNELRANMVRVDSDFSATPFKAKIADAEKPRVHTMLVIGGRDMEAGAVGVRLHHGGPQGAKPKVEVVADILASIKERRA